MIPMPDRADCAPGPAGKDWCRLRAHLQATARLLWDVAPPLHAKDSSDAVRLSRHGLTLPLCLDAASDPGEREACRAAIAHAGAHLVHSTHRFDPQGLKPITMALIGLLEDARVERLACRELPGLRRLWAPFHQTSADEAGNFESLMCRLSRALLLPEENDPHPWVVKGRGLFFGSAAQGRVDQAASACAGAGFQPGPIDDPASLRHIASLLGNDIGQMRLSFNAKTYRVQPTYRDDNHWLWQPSGAVSGLDSAALELPAHARDAASRAATSPPSGGLQPRDSQVSSAIEAHRLDRPIAQADAPLDSGSRSPTELAIPADLTVHLYPEWDRLIGRSRAQWCSVLDSAAAGLALPSTADGCNPSRAAEVLRIRARSLRPWVPQWADQASRRSVRQTDGDSLDIEALVECGVALRVGQRPDERVYQGRERRRRDSVTVCLLDLSASTARSSAEHMDTGLDHARIAALAEAWAEGSPALGDRSACALHGFWSDGRHRVHYQRIKDFDEPVDAQVLDRLLRLRSEGSTRLGAALRHASALLLARRTPRMNLLVISDGETHDIDVHDPKYLSEDARHAVREARAQGVAVRCLALDPAMEVSLRAIFGRDGYRLLPNAGLRSG
ncbi:MAG: hypothetical protein ACKVOX_08650 [Rhizobacter sp.]